MWGNIAIAFLLAFIVSFMATPYTIKIAHKIGAVDVPKDKRRMHKRAMPKFGGPAVILGFIVSMIYLIIIMTIFGYTTVCSAEEAVIMPSQEGKVVSINYADTNDEISGTRQIVSVKILTGIDKGNIVELDNMLSGNPYYDIKLKKNTKVVLHAEENNGIIQYSIEDVKRSGTLLWLSILFCSLLVYVGKKKGLYSLVSIAITIVLITNVLSPLILFGINPILASIIVCILSTAATMYLVGGFNAKSTSATLGAVLSLAFAAVLSGITMCTAGLTGFASENTQFLYSAHPELNYVGITIAAMVLATLGAVMDVAMSIASTINEIYLTDNTKSVKELFISGMNVGRDIIGTMANTLILVYLGGSLQLLLLAGNIDINKFINLNQVVTEIASAIIGSIAIVICVPFTALVASILVHKYAKLAKYDNIEIN